MVDAPHRAEQTDERSGRTDRGEPRQTTGQIHVDALDRALQRKRHPLVKIDTFVETTFVVLTRTHAVFGDRAEGVTLRQTIDGFVDRTCRPELLLGQLGRRQELTLVDELHEDDVPRRQRHDDHDDESSLGDEISLFPESSEAVRVLDYCGGYFVFHDFLSG